MGRILRRPAARQDLISIWHYIAKQSGADRADAYLMRVEQRLVMLAENPGLGRARLQSLPEVRVHLSESHLLFYIALDSGTGIELVRVLHGAQNWTRLMQSGTQSS